ncbi:MAG: phosphatidate cytidylyltransferase [Gemmatimonadales bacterium]
MSGNLIRRIAFAVVAIPAVLVVLYAGGWILVGLLAILGMLGTRELYGLARQQQVHALEALGLFGALLLPVAQGTWVLARVAPCAQCPGTSSWIVLLALWLMGVLVAATRARAPGQRPLAAVAVTVFAPLYASGLLSFVLLLRHAADAPLASRAGLWIAALPLVLTWICDTAAMAAGKLIGGAKLAPVVSPNKTWAGAIAGTVAALVAAVAYGSLVLSRYDVHLGVLHLVTVGGVVAVAGQVGDVAESLFKREVGVKDSSTLIPGHGGILDRLDSLYFAVPAAAAVYLWFARV